MRKKLIKIGLMVGLMVGLMGFSSMACEGIEHKEDDKMSYSIISAKEDVILLAAENVEFTTIFNPLGRATFCCVPNISSTPVTLIGHERITASTCALVSAPGRICRGCGAILSYGTFTRINIHARGVGECPK